MKRRIAVATAVSALFTACSAEALPLLQLDIQGGTYVGGSDQTTYAAGSSFTLYALIKDLAPGGNYALSAAIVPKSTLDPLTQFGSFSIDGTTYSSAIGNVNYGTPPVDTTFADIPGHGIFDTHYAELAFSFNTAHKLLNYDVEDQWMMDPEGRFSANGNALYAAFDIDASGLAAGYSIHFDLYDRNEKNAKFAPFSHDAQSGPRRTGGANDPTLVPDGGTTIALLGTGLCALGALRRRISKNKA